MLVELVITTIFIQKYDTSLLNIFVKGNQYVRARVYNRTASKLKLSSNVQTKLLKGVYSTLMLKNQNYIALSLLFIK